MMPRTASLLLADDLLTTISGKQILHGIYTADLAIPFSGVQVSQLVAYLIIEADATDKIVFMTAEIQFPENAPTQVSISVPPDPPEITLGRTKQIIKQATAISGVVLHPGKISVKVIHDKGELSVAAPWIILAGTPFAGNPSHGERPDVAKPSLLDEDSVRHSKRGDYIPAKPSRRRTR